MKKLTLSMLLLFLIGSVSAHSFEAENLETGNLEHYQEEINLYSDRVPNFLASVIGDQTINVKIKSNDTEKEVGIKMNGTIVQDIKMNGYENATLEVETTEEQINSITTSKEPIQELNRKLKNGEISYTSKGALNSLRTFIAEQLLSIASLL